MQKKIFLSIGLLGTILFIGFFSFEKDEVREPASASEVLKVENFVHLDKVRLIDFKPQHFFLLSNTQSYSQIKLINFLSAPQEKIKLEATLTCDQPIWSMDQRNLGRQHQFYLEAKTSIDFLLSPKIKKCQLIYKNWMQPQQTSTLQLITETSAFPILDSLIRRKDHCPEATSETASSLEKIFQSTDFSNMTCPEESSGPVVKLTDSEDGFLAKAEALLGYRLNSSFITNQNPYSEIDFSHAPQLSAIFVSTLVYRADFYGTVIARLLKFHADRGTVVHVITTEYMMLDKDKVLLHRLANENGNFRLQEFKYYDSKNILTKPLRYIDSKFRDMHIKLFVTLSKDPSQNKIIFGGRNIHDGFLFKTKPDHSKYPALVNYGVDEDFVHWNDFEMQITSVNLARLSYAHLLKFWNRDTFTQTVESFTSSSSSTQEALPIKFNSSAGPIYRHMISLPYNDHQSLESLYVSLIDSAEKSLMISSPYLRPTPKITAALDRAILRKVDITIQTRINLEGDTQAWLYTEVNKESINRFVRKITMYEWKDNSILHSKFMIVDGKISFIGSVNLSRRSFIQDVENGFLISDEKVASEMTEIFNKYHENSALITEEQKRKWFPTLVIELLKNQF